MSTSSEIEKYKNNQIKEIKILEKLNKKLNPINGCMIISPNYKNLNSSSIINEKSETTTDRLVTLIGELEDFINIMNLKYKNLVKQVEKIDNQYNALNTNFQRLVYIVISHSKSIKEIENCVDNINCLIKNFQAEQCKFKKMNELKDILIKQKNDKFNDMDETVKSIKNMVDEINKLNINDIKREIDKISSSTNNYNSQIDKLYGEISNLQKSINLSDNSKDSKKYDEDDENKIIQLVNNYHENIKSNISKINKDLNKLFERYNYQDNVSKICENERISINIYDLNLNDFSSNMIKKGNVISIISQSNEKNIIIKKKYGLIKVPNINTKKYVDIMGKIKLFNSKKNETYKGFITNKNFMERNSDGNIIFVFPESNNIPFNFSFEGFITLKIKFME